MKITYISNSIIPSREANSIQVMKMCEALGNRGHKVVLLIPDRETDVDTDVYEYYGVDQTFRVKKLPWFPLKGYQFTVLAALVARKRESDLVYGRSIAGCYFSTRLGINVIYESHSPADQIHPITNRMFQRLLTRRYFIRLVVISDALGEYYRRQYEIGDKIQTAHDAADIPDGEPIEEIRSRDGLQAGYVGQLYEGKGIRLIAKLANERPDVTFHVVGGTEEDIKLWKSRTMDYDNIVYHGFVDPSRVPDYHASFDVLLAPFQQEVYGTQGNTDLSMWMSPLKIFEYMAAERPIICSDLPVLREILQDDETAYLCPPDDLSAWSSTLSEIAENNKKATEIASKARQVYEKNYTYDKRVEQVLAGIN